MNVEKLKRDKTALVDELKSIQASAQGRSYTADENAIFERNTAKIQELHTAIEREEFLAKETAEAALRADNRRVETKSEFRSVGDFLNEVLFVRNSTRIADAMKRTTSLGIQDAAGALVPAQFDKTLRKIDGGEVVVRPRATVIPAGDSPDATLNLITFDQSGNKGIYGGATSEWVSENGDRTATNDLSVKTVSFSPFINSSWIPVSNSLRNNYDGLEALVTSYLADAINNSEDKAFLTGDGIGKPTGFIGHPCNATVTRTTQGQIKYEDIIKLLSLTVGVGGYTFIVSKSAMPSILNLQNGANQLIFQPNAVEGSPGTLMGYPVIFTDRVPALGTQGDITLANLKSYVIKDGSNVTLFADSFTLAHKGVTRLFAQFNVDGKPIISTAIKGEDGVSRSPFVSLV